jgi:hypothetical protein
MHPAEIDENEHSILTLALPKSGFAAGERDPLDRPGSEATVWDQPE